MVQSRIGGAVLLLALVCGAFACGGGRKGAVDAAGGIDVGAIAAGGTTAGTGAGGASTAALLDLDGSRMDFGFVTPGTTTVGKFTLTNRGGAISGLPVSSISLDRNPGGAATPLTVTGCNAALAAGASCVLTISVTPPVLGLFQAFVHVSANPGTETYGSSGLPIYVVGWATGFSVSSPTRIDLGDLAPGVAVKRSITITATIALSDLKVWPAGSEVSVDASATTCTATLAQGASCVVAVTFVASTLGWKRDIIGVKAGGDFGQTVNIEVIANVTKASDLAIVPTEPPHFVCVFEKTSAPVVFTVTNLGDTPSGTIASTIVGADSSGIGARDFAVSQTNCTVLAPHATCSISVVCTPAMSASADTREVILSVSDGSTHLAVPLAGDVSFGP